MPQITSSNLVWSTSVLPKTSTLLVNDPTATPASGFIGFPQLDQPRGLTPPFLAPNLIVPIDSSDPSKVVGNSYSAQISHTRSTLFVFDVPPSANTCSLVFAMPPVFDSAYMSPIQMHSPGGISVSRLNNAANARTSTWNTAVGTDVGAVPAILPGNTYTIASAPCEAGQQVGYKADSLNGLDIDFFQMTSPAIGFFVEIS